jgi:hypothetical protein
MSTKRTKSTEFDAADNQVDDAADERITAQLPTNSQLAAAQEAAAVVAADKAAIKRCAKHAVNFPDEPEMRPRSEFYGQAKSSYCKRCMAIQHKERRIADRGEPGEADGSYKALLNAIRTAANQTVTVCRDQPDTLEGDPFDMFTDALRAAFNAWLAQQTAN